MDTDPGETADPAVTKLSSRSRFSYATLCSADLDTPIYAVCTN